MRHNRHIRVFRSQEKFSWIRSRFTIRASANCLKVITRAFSLATCERMRSRQCHRSKCVDGCNHVDSRAWNMNKPSWPTFGRLWFRDYQEKCIYVLASTCKIVYKCARLSKGTLQRLYVTGRITVVTNGRASTRKRITSHISLFLSLSVTFLLFLSFACATHTRARACRCYRWSSFNLRTDKTIKITWRKTAERELTVRLISVCNTFLFKKWNKYILRIKRKRKSGEERRRKV